MGRIRTIKPDFPQSESMGRVSREARLLFILLWTIVDDSGRARASSRMLASILYPYDDDAISKLETWMSELGREGCVTRYYIDNNLYLQINNWENHQRIDRPSLSKISPIDESSRVLDESSRGLDNILLGREGKGKESTTPLPPSQGEIPQKRKRRTRTQMLDPFPQDLRDMVNRLLDLWPDKRQDGSPVTNSPEASAQRIQEILGQNSEISLEILEQSAMEYLEGKPTFPNALQFFFGSGKPGKAAPYVAITRKILTVRQDSSLSLVHSDFCQTLLNLPSIIQDRLEVS